MNLEGYMAYEKLIERKGKAYASDIDVQVKFENVINDITRQLSDGFDEYFEFWLTGGKNDFTETEKRILGCFIRLKGRIVAAVIQGQLKEAHSGLEEMRVVLEKLRGVEVARV